jgi:hypothetical protein
VAPSTSAAREDLERIADLLRQLGYLAGPEPSRFGDLGSPKHPPSAAPERAAAGGSDLPPTASSVHVLLPTRSGPVQEEFVGGDEAEPGPEPDGRLTGVQHDAFEPEVGCVS